MSPNNFPIAVDRRFAWTRPPLDGLCAGLEELHRRGDRSGDCRDGGRANNLRPGTSPPTSSPSGVSPCPRPPCAASDTGKRPGDYKERLRALEGQAYAGWAGPDQGRARSAAGWETPRHDHCL